MKDVNLLINNGVNIAKGLELFGDIETYNLSLNDFLAEVPEKLVKIKGTKETSDMANYAIYTHSLKSDAKYFGFEKLAELAYDHELKSKERNILYVTEHYEELMTEANRIVNLVRAYLNGTSSASMAQPVQTAPIMPTVAPIAPQILNSTDKAILVVDDSDIIRKYVINIFKNDFVVLIANDGAEAIEIVKSNLDKNIIGMLLDLNMPNVDGFQVLEFFKVNNLFKRIPVSIITGNDNKEVDLKAFEYPIVDILKKPFNERDVKTIIDKTILSNLQS